MLTSTLAYDLRSSRVGAVRTALARIRREVQRTVSPWRIPPNVDGLLVALQPVLSKRQQHAILVIMTVEKRADVDVEGQVLSH